MALTAARTGLAARFALIERPYTTGRLSRVTKSAARAMGLGASKPASADGFDGLGLKVPEAYGLPTPTAESKRKLEQLLKANHFTFSILFNRKKFHNHAPHHLVSAYYLGATPQQLNEVYESQADELDPWQEDSPDEVTDQDWRQLRGKKQYTSAWKDYITDKVSEVSADDWASVARSYLFEKKDNLFVGLYGGLVHPLIHLGYAVETDNPLIGIEAIAMCGTEYSDFRSTLDAADVTVKDSDKTSDPLEIITEIRNDKDLNGKIKEQRDYTVPKLIEYQQDKMAYYTQRLRVPDTVDKTLVASLMKACALLLSTTQIRGDPQYDFFLLHLLTSSHELFEICLSPLGRKALPPDTHKEALRLQWSQVVAMYINAKRPLVKPELLDEVEIESPAAAWRAIIDKALTGPQRLDAHYVKAIRAFLFAHVYLGDEDLLFTKAAYKFANEFANLEGYGGYNAKRSLDVTD